MKTFDVQSVAIDRRFDTVFDYISDSRNLPQWTEAFAAADDTTATLNTPRGEVAIALETRAHRETGAVDWIMTFPDGTVGAAYSRITPDGSTRSVYSFVLMAPPVPLEELEGALSAQMVTLSHELAALRTRIEADADN
jgi:hypothetical protein